MTKQLQVSLGQCSAAGVKEINQDFHSACTPREPQKDTKGIAAAVADGIGTSDVSQIASEAAVTGFLEDYFSTSDAWSVKKSAQRVLMSINSWLYSQTRNSQYRHDMDRGYVCTLSAVVFKGALAHVFHVGDSRVYRRAGKTLEQLTSDHRIHITSGESYLGTALGARENVEIEYQCLKLDQGDTFVLTTDGVHEFVRPESVTRIIDEYATALEEAARLIVQQALEHGSDDNLTVQIVRVDARPEPGPSAIDQQMAELPFPPLLAPRMEFDGYRIVRSLHASNRSHVYLAVDLDTGDQVALKTLSTEMEQDRAQLERFFMEEWIARRVDSPYVLRALPPERRRNYLYTVMEYIEGQTLTQWMRDHPSPDLPTVRAIVDQIARGLRAFHRMEMVHQDLRPDNVLIDATGTVKLIDFGATRVAGLQETFPDDGPEMMPGTMQYSAPEYFLGGGGTPRSDIFSLGVITYQMVSGQLPYGTAVAGTRTRREQQRLSYHSVLPYNPELPFWIDGPLRRALHPEPERRYEALSEFLFDLEYGRGYGPEQPRPPLLERNPLVFWQGISLILAVAVVVLLVMNLN